MRWKVPALALAGLLAVSLAGCGGGPARSAGPSYTEVRMQSSAGQPEVLLEPRGPVDGLVLFEHGFDQTQDAIARLPSLAPLRDALIGAGLAIAASYSHGNNFGNPASVEDQVRLVDDAERRLPTVSLVDVVAFSMGGLDALLTASDHAVPGLRNLVLLSPGCDQVPYLQTGFAAGIRAAFGNGSGPALLRAVEASDPERRDPRSYRGYRFWFWESPGDTTVVPAQPAGMMAILRSAGIAYRFSPLDGNHGDLQRLQPAQVAQFLAGR